MNQTRFNQVALVVVALSAGDVFGHLFHSMLLGGAITLGGYLAGKKRVGV
jgi:hypothetical protein